jgi:hypothetical protein
MDLKELGWGMWTGFVWLRLAQVARFCVQVNETLGSTKCGEYVV